MLNRTGSRICRSCSAIHHDGSTTRRSVLVLGAATITISMLQSRAAIPASGNYEAMVLTCIDPRIQEPVHDYLAKNHLTGQFSQFVIAGAAIGVISPAFADWHKTFWDNLGVSVELHHIKKVIAIDHRDCGAAKIAYGDAKVASATVETETHRVAMNEFRRQVSERQPKLAVETVLMALDGSITTIR